MNRMLLVAVALLAVACTKHPVQVAGQVPTTELEKMGAVQMQEAAQPAPKVTQVTVQAPVVAPTLTHTKTKHRKTDADRAALALEEKNFYRAACLNWAVDQKIAYDVATHEIHDFGNVLTMPVCAEFKS